NGDGFGDVIIGEPNYSNGESYEGRALVYLGSASGLGATPAWAVESNRSFLDFGGIVGSAGDVNRDGFGDVVVGAPGGFSQPNVFVYLGSPTGLSTVSAWSLDSGSHPGAAVPVFASTAGDVNGDGFGDLIVAGASKVSVYPGGPAGLSTAPLWTVTSEFTSAVGAAGDVNGDGYGDVLIGQPFPSSGQPAGRCA